MKRSHICGSDGCEICEKNEVGKRGKNTNSIPDSPRSPSPERLSINTLPSKLWRPFAVEAAMTVQPRLQAMRPTVIVPTAVKSSPPPAHGKSTSIMQTPSTSYERPILAIVPIQQTSSSTSRNQNLQTPKERRILTLCKALIR